MSFFEHVLMILSGCLRGFIFFSGFAYWALLGYTACCFSCFKYSVVILLFFLGVKVFGKFWLLLFWDLRVSLRSFSSVSWLLALLVG